VAASANLGQFGDDYAGLDQAPADRLWSILRSYLDKYDAATSLYRCHELVAGMILAAGREVALPIWLTRFYAVRLAEGDALGAGER